MIAQKPVETPRFLHNQWGFDKNSGRLLRVSAYLSFNYDMLIHDDICHEKQ